MSCKLNAMQACAHGAFAFPFQVFPGAGASTSRPIISIKIPTS